jgi:hypothetical protein
MEDDMSWSTCFGASARWSSRQFAIHHRTFSLCPQHQRTCDDILAVVQDELNDLRTQVGIQIERTGPMQPLKISWAPLIVKG